MAPVKIERLVATAYKPSPVSQSDVRSELHKAEQFRMFCSVSTNGTKKECRPLQRRERYSSADDGG
jgi:hypothetical protein